MNSFYFQVNTNSDDVQQYFGVQIQKTCKEILLSNFFDLLLLL